jgi:hypothetical protein
MAQDVILFIPLSLDRASLIWSSSSAVRISGIDDSWRQVAGIRFDVQRYDPLSERMLNPPHDLKTGKRLPPPGNQALLQGLIRFNERGYLHESSLGDSDIGLFST